MTHSPRLFRPYDNKSLFCILDRQLHYAFFSSLGYLSLVRSMDPLLQGFLHSSVNGASSQVAGDLYRSDQEQHDPLLAPLPPTLDMASYVCMDCPDLIALSNSFADLMESQRCELEQYLKLQNEWLRTNLLYQSKQHVLSLMSAFESKASFLLSQNDEELRRTRDQVSTLGERLKREMEEKETWKRIACEKEAMVISMLNGTERMQSQANIEEEVGSSINVLEGEKGKQPEGPRSDLIPCKACGTRSARILLLPCRHLCACEHCAPSLDACPVCHFEKIGSIEVSLD